jgi:hypothetical protein
MIYKTTASDIPWMVKLSHQKRLDYSMAQENFWKMAPNSDELQAKWFESEIIRDEVIALCAKDSQGFVIGKIVNPPEIYDAGLTLMIDDFCVKSPTLWLSVGLHLLNEIISQAKARGVAQILVVCGSHDLAKLQLLEKLDLSCASKWHTKPI